MALLAGFEAFEHREDVLYKFLQEMRVPQTRPNEAIHAYQGLVLEFR